MNKMNKSRRQVEKTDNKLQHHNGTIVSGTNNNSNILGQDKSNDAITDNGNTILVVIQAAGAEQPRQVVADIQMQEDLEKVMEHQNSGREREH